jgi:RimJ/RimL family protein N-acetyltransferase
VTGRELLRLHIEAVWGLTLPPFDESAHELVLSGQSPPWSLYVGTFAGEQLVIWHPEVTPERWLLLLEHARQAGVTWEETYAMRREVVFQAPIISPRQQAYALQFARVLNADDADLLDAMWPEEAPIVLKWQQAPYVGVVVDGRLVSVAHNSRRTPSACELGIDTLPDARRKGYAAAATTLWTALVQGQGLVPIYSAFVWNIPSVRLAQSVGYLPRIEGVYGPVPENGE